MKKTMISILALLLCICILTGCGGAGKPAAMGKATASAKTITIAYQGGIGYAPVHVMEVKKLIENNYKDDIQLTFTKLDSGAAINEGIIGGTIDIGCMGLAPAISGVSKGLPYKVISSLCAQSHGLMSNDPNITKLTDITPTDKIALVNTGSIQHILLSMCSEKVLGDPHALDNNIQPMSHAEGMASLESGTVKLHLTSSPFIYQERDSGKYTELKELSEVWPKGSTFLVAMASTKLAEDKELFEAVSNAFEQAISFINDNPDEAAKIEEDYLKLDLDTVKGYLEQPDCQFSSGLYNADAMASFMLRAGFIEKAITMDDFKYPNVESN